MTGAQIPAHQDSKPLTAWQRLTAQQKTEATRQAVAAEGKSYGQAALVLGTSRVAIAGVVERSRRTANPIESKSGLRNVKGVSKGKQKKPKPPTRALRKIVTPVVYATGTPADPTPVVSSAWLPLPGSNPVPIAEHKEGMCRWPLGADRPFLYCGAAVSAGKVYCAGHCAVAFRELPPKKEIADAPR